MQFRRVNLTSIGPPSQKKWPNLSFVRFAITMGGEGLVLRGGKETYLGKMHFLTSVSIGPRTKKRLCAIWISQKGCFCETPYSAQPLLLHISKISTCPTCRWRCSRPEPSSTWPPPLSLRCSRQSTLLSLIVIAFKKMQISPHLAFF